MPEGRKFCAPPAPSFPSLELPGRVAFEGGAHYSFHGIGSLRILSLGRDGMYEPARSDEGTTARGRASTERRTI